MGFGKHAAYTLLICMLSLAALACGELFKNDGGKSLDDRIPKDWDGVDDWPGSEWEVTEE